MLDSAEHHNLAHEAAIKSFVLLKRVAAPTPSAGGIRSVGSATAEMTAAVTVHLFLSDATPATIAVIGPAADNRTALINRYTGSPINVTTMLGGIRARAAAAPANITVGYASGSDVPAAAALAARSTVAVVVLTATPRARVVTVTSSVCLRTRSPCSVRFSRGALWVPPQSPLSCW